MTSRLPWVAAAILIVAVAAGTWAIYGVKPTTQPTVQPPTTPAAGGGWTGLSVWAGATPSESGIENAYFMQHAFGNDDDAANDNSWNTDGPKENENIHEYADNDQVLRGSGDTVTVNYDNAFDIAVAFKVHNNQTYSVTSKDNFGIHLALTIGSWTYSENTIYAQPTATKDNMFQIEVSGSTWARYVAVFDNGGPGFSLAPGESMTIDNIALYAWK